jgi:hypothetical protein
VASSDEQISFVYFTRRSVLLKRGKVIIKNECMFVVGISIAAGPFVPWAEIAFRVVTRRDSSIGLFLLALPRAFCAVWRNNQPFVCQWIESTM